MKCSKRIFLATLLSNRQLIPLVNACPLTKRPYKGERLRQAHLVLSFFCFLLAFCGRHKPPAAISTRQADNVNREMDLLYGPQSCNLDSQHGGVTNDRQRPDSL